MKSRERRGTKLQLCGRNKHRGQVQSVTIVNNIVLNAGNFLRGCISDAFSTKEMVTV